MARLVQALPKCHKHKAVGHAIVTLNGFDHSFGRHGANTCKELRGD